MSTWLFLLGSACLILAPDNPVGMLILFLVACLRVRRSSEMEIDDYPGSGGNCTIDQQDLLRDGDLT